MRYKDSASDHVLNHFERPMVSQSVELPNQSIESSSYYSLFGVMEDELKILFSRGVQDFGIQNPALPC